MIIIFIYLFNFVVFKYSTNYRNYKTSKCIFNFDVTHNIVSICPKMYFSLFYVIVKIKKNKKWKINIKKI